LHQKKKEDCVAARKRGGLGEIGRCRKGVNYFPSMDKESQKPVGGREFVKEERTILMEPKN